MVTLSRNVRSEQLDRNDYKAVKNIQLVLMSGLLREIELFSFLRERVGQLSLRQLIIITCGIRMRIAPNAHVSVRPINPFPDGGAASFLRPLEVTRLRRCSSQPLVA